MALEYIKRLIEAARAKGLPVIYTFKMECEDCNVGYGLFACFAKLRRGLFVIGFTASDANVIVPDDNVDWMSPDAPSVLLADPRFLKKL